MKNISVALALIIIVTLALAPFYILKESFNNKPSDQSIRAHWNTGNTTRLLRPLSFQMAKILNLDDSDSNKVVILSSNKDLLATLASVGFQAPIFFVEDQLTNKLKNEIKRLKPSGLKDEKRSQVLLIGNALKNIEQDIVNLGYQPRTINGNDVDFLVSQLAVIIAHENSSKNLIVVRKEEFRSILPTASLLAHYGIPLLSVGESTIPNDTKRLLQELSQEEKLNLYFVSLKNVPDKILTEFSKYGKVKEIKGEDKFDLAIQIAEYFDVENNFGWWANGNTPEGGHNYILTNPKEVKKTILASLLSVKGKFGPILLTNQKQLPVNVEQYYWKMKPDFWQTPAEGPYNHTWIIGDFKDISYAVQGRVDFLQEIQPYGTYGAQGVSGLEMMVLLWIMVGLFGAGWITFHLFIRQPSISYLMKLAWIILILITGPVGIWAYYQAYKGYDTQVAMGDWPRPLWIQALVSTISSLAFGAGGMIVITLLLLIFGMPLLFVRGSLFVFGNNMLLAMIISYLGAFCLNSLLFVPTMLRMGKRMNYKEAVKDSLVLVALSMTAVSIGMMGGMWWLQMEYLAMMPEESELLWLGTVYWSILAGLIIAYPVNWFLVRSDRKRGRM